jgi:hypothetical protein
MTGATQRDAWYEPPGDAPPWDDPRGLLEYVRRSADIDLGSYSRMWLAEKSATIMRRSSSPVDRQSLRDAVLMACERGRQAVPGIPFTVWLYWATIARIGYMREANNGREWDECEAEGIYDNFIAAIGVDSNEMSDALAGRYEIHFQVDSRMAGELAMTVRAMARLSQLLPAHKWHELEHWISMAEQIGHWTNSDPDLSSS